MGDVTEMIAAIMGMAAEDRVLPFLTMMGVPQSMIDAMPASLKTPQFINMEFFSAFAGLPVTAAAGIPGVAQFATFQADFLAVNYSLPGILIGCAWPLIFIGLGVTLWRALSKPSARTILLLFSMLFAVGEAVIVSHSKVVKPLTTTEGVKRALTLATIFFSNFRPLCTLSAAGLRFSTLYTSPSIQKIIIGACSTIGVIGTLSACAIGYDNVLNKGLGLTFTFWGVAFICIITYLIAGLAVAALKLQTSSFSRGDSGPTALDEADLALTALSLASCIVALGVALSLDMDTSFMVTPVVFLFNIVWSVSEAFFEVLTYWKNTPRGSEKGGAGQGAAVSTSEKKAPMHDA
ncbi:hypothetical protein HDU85_000945 [Gaertneriomyces sp. JEL0708]|nr:hypothetical protein HDU85_000945 [Gaertneriomyces sp. JEL0708]